MDRKLFVIVGLTLLALLLHLGAGHASFEWHAVHRELLFIPILLCSLWFGLRPGLALAAIISLFYGLGIGMHHASAGLLATLFSQVAMFFIVAFLVGSLSERQAKRHEEALAAQRLALLGRASAAVGHDLRHMIQAVRHLVLEAGGLGAPERDKAFATEVANMERMLEALHSVAPKMGEARVSHNVNDIVEQALVGAKKALTKNSLHVSKEFCEGGCLTMAMTEHVRDAVAELLLNAASFTPRGGAVHVSTRKEEDFCTVTVRDEGPGISPANMHKIFQPFFTTKENGSGLGLASSRKVLRDLGGDITVLSEDGRGASFTISIPRGSESDMRDKLQRIMKHKH